MSSRVLIEEDTKVPLLKLDLSSTGAPSKDDGQDHDDDDLARRVWIESKKLWHILGPSIFSRLSSYSMLVITNAFAGHLGELELAAISIAFNVIVGFDFGLLVYFFFLIHDCIHGVFTFSLVLGHEQIENKGR